MSNTLDASSGHLSRVHHHKRLVADAMAAITDDAAAAAAAHYAEGVGHAAPQSGASPGSSPTGGAA